MPGRRGKEVQDWARPCKTVQDCARLGKTASPINAPVAVEAVWKLVGCSRDVGEVAVEQVRAGHTRTGDGG